MKKLQFINELYESKLIPSKQKIKDFNKRELSDILFLYFLTLQILKQEFKTAPVALKYVKDTIQWNNFDSFKHSGTDLYVLLFLLFGKNNESFTNMLKDQEANELLSSKLYLNEPMTNTWFKNVIRNKDDENFDGQFLLKLEQALHIQNPDYKNIRRLVSNWDDLSHEQKQIATTRILLALRAKAKNGDLLKALENLSKEEKLEIKNNIKNPEEKKSGKLSKTAVAIGAGVGGLFTGRQLYKLAKHATKKSNYNENATGGATASGAIGSIPLPLGTEVNQRNPKKKKSPKTDK